MMRWVSLSTPLPVAVALVALPAPSRADAGEAEETAVSGELSVAGKVDDNIDLARQEDPEGDPRSDLIAELAGRVRLERAVGDHWYLTAALGLRGDLLSEHTERRHRHADGTVYLGYQFGDNAVSLLDELHCFDEPGEAEFDRCRNAASLVYRRTLSPRWQLRGGYENVAAYYHNSEFFNYHLHGGFIELRNPWTEALSTFLRLGRQYYLGSYNAQTGDPESSPSSGTRSSGTVGFDLLLSGHDSLSGTGSVQVDSSSGQGVNQIGARSVDDEALEVDAEFDFVKLRLSLLYSHRLGRLLTLSVYQELIRKNFFDEPLRQRREVEDGPKPERIDVLWLGSAWLSARLSDQVYAKARYVHRRNHSTVRAEEYRNHIFYLGLEYRF